MARPGFVWLVSVSLVTGLALVGEPLALSALTRPPRQAPAPQPAPPIRPTAYRPPPAPPAKVDAQALTQAALAQELVQLIRQHHVDGGKLTDRVYRDPLEVLVALNDPTAVFESADYDRGYEVETIAARPETRAATPEEDAELDALERDLDAIEPENQSAFGYTGLMLTGRGRDCLIAGVVDGSPAALAGLSVGDRIVGVNGVDVTGELPWVVAGRVARSFANQLTLTIEPPCGWMTVSVSLPLPKEPVFAKPSVLRYDDGRALVRIPTLDGPMATDLAAALAEARKRGPIHGVVVDLRANPGGTLMVAHQVAKLLMPKRAVHFQVTGRTPVLYGQGAPVDLGPIVVLVNRGTGGSAEVLAQALRENAGATIVGSGTQGRNDVFVTAPLSDGSLVRLRVGALLTGQGTTIDKSGVVPDRLTGAGQRLSQDPRLDPGLAAALEKLAGR